MQLYCTCNNSRLGIIGEERERGEGDIGVEGGEGKGDIEV